MMNMIPFSDDSVIGLGIAGKISGDELDEAIAAIEEKMARNDKLRLYVEMQSFSGMSIEALFKDMKFGISNWDRFEKEAIVTDKAWMEKVAAAADKLLGSVEVKTFPPEEKGFARQWVLS